MRNLFSSPLGAIVAPIGNLKCSAAAVAIGAGVGAGVAGIAGGVANLLSSADTNKTNYKIWQEQLAYAREQYEKERLENRALINEEREYNLPVNERQRLLDAGINPSLAKYGGSSSLSSVGVGSTPHAAFPDAPTMMKGDYSFIGDSIRNGLNLVLDSELKSAQVEAVRQNTNNEYLKTLDTLKNSKLDRETKRALLQDMSRKWTFENETWDARKKAITLANESVFANTQKLHAETDFQRLKNQFEPKVQHNLERVWADSHDEVMSRIQLNDIQGAYNYALKMLSDEQRLGVKLENINKADMAQAIVDRAYYEAEEQYWKSEQAGRNYLLGNKIGSSTPAMDLNGKTYSSPYKTYHTNRHDRERFVPRKRPELDHVGTSVRYHVK